MTYTPQAYAAEESCPWPEWIPQDWVLDRAEQLVPEYAALGAEESSAAGRELAEQLTSQAGAALADRDIFWGTRRPGQERACELLARVIALGSTCLEGITVFDIHARWTP